MELTEPSTPRPLPPKPELPNPGSDLRSYAAYLVKYAGFTYATIRVLSNAGSYRSFAGNERGRDVIDQFCRIGQEARKLAEDTSFLSCVTYKYDRLVYLYRYDFVAGMSIEVAGCVSDGGHRKHMPRTVRRLTDRILRDRTSIDLTTAETR